MATAQYLQDATRKGKMYFFDPMDLWIEGFDVNDESEGGGPNPDWLADDRVKEKLDPGLVESIKTHGIISPVTITAINGRPYVVDGRRRVLHARECNRMYPNSGVLVPCISATGNTKSLYELSVAANLHRKNEHPIGEAQKMLRHIETFGATEDETAELFGVSRGTVRNRLKLLELPARVQGHIASGKLSPSMGIELLKLWMVAKDEEADGRDQAKEDFDAALTAALAKAAASGSTHGQRNVGPSREVDPDRPRAIPAGRLRKLLETDWAANDENAEYVRMLRVITGEISHTSIKGLAAALREASGAKQAPPREIEA